MKQSTRDARAAEIEEAAFTLIAENGFLNTSMLAVAKAAKASNETLYRWYGDKTGLFKALVTRNTANVSEELQRISAKDRPALEGFAKVGPRLLEMLLDERAVSLNRAAAADATGTLGQALATSGRETVFPLIRDVCAKAQRENALGRANPAELAQTYVTLLVGDLQIRRTIGVLDPLTRNQIESRAAHALHALQQLYPTHLDVTGAKP